MRRYGGVDNAKSFDQIQEAYVVSAPGISKVIKKKSIISIVLGWCVFFIISYIITNLFIVIVSDGKATYKMPFWAFIIAPAIPFLFIFVFKMIKFAIIKKRTGHKD
jgi:archaellum biogenesis protein FlaJ (TadC family)